jgi:hypothetical protein
VEITLIFFAVVGIHTVISLVHYRAGVFLAVTLYAVYPKFLSLGLSSEGFALTGQRAMLSILFGIYILRVLWGSAEIRHGFALMARYKPIMYSLVAFILARLVGNFVSGRIDVGSIAAFISEMLLSIFIAVLVFTYVRNRKDILNLLTLVLVSLLANQFASVYEFYSDGSIYPASIEIQYETTRTEDAMLEGKSREERYRTMGFFDNPLKLAGLLCLFLPLAMFLSVHATSLMTRLFATMSVAMALPTALFTGSRAAIGATVAIFSWYLYRTISRNMSRIGRRALFSASFVLVAIVIYIIASGLIEAILFGEEYQRSTEARWTQFITVPLYVAEYPVFGRGYARNIAEIVGMYTLDSFYLRIALEGGIVALIAFILYLFRASRLLSPISRVDIVNFDTSLAKALRVSIGTCAILMTIFSFAYLRMYVFVVVAVAIVLHSLYKEANKRVLPPKAESPLHERWEAS